MAKKMRDCDSIHVRMSVARPTVAPASTTYELQVEPHWKSANERGFATFKSARYGTMPTKTMATAAYRIETSARLPKMAL